MSATAILDSPTASPGVRCSDGFSIPREQLNILRHAVGVDDDGHDRYPHATSMDERRNRFVTDPASEDGKNCQRLVSLKLMADHGPQKMMGGMHFYTVTDEGMEVVLLHKPWKPKTSRAKQRYQDFLDADCGLRFGEWLKRKRC